jgi:tetratricopeptide (TPR) repeat protein
MGFGFPFRSIWILRVAAVADITRSVWNLVRRAVDELFNFLPAKSDRLILSVWILIGGAWGAVILNLEFRRALLWNVVTAVIEVVLSFLLSLGINHCFFVYRTTTALQAFAVSAGLLMVVGAMALQISLFNRDPAFSPGSGGILVLRMRNDHQDSLQQRLLGSLNHRLAAHPLGARIPVLANHAIVTEDAGEEAAHDAARAIGRDFHAALVIWGVKIDDTRFYPRITIVGLPQGVGNVELTYEVQDVSTLKLPEQMVSEPIFLTRCALGFTVAQRGDYHRAIEYLNGAINTSPTPGGNAELKAFTATLHLRLAVHSQSDDEAARAIHLLNDVTAYFAPRDRYKWALAKSNLAVAYAVLRNGNRSDNLLKAIAACQDALLEFTKENNPAEWATVQLNLGNAYGALRSGDRKRNLQSAIAAFDAALRVRTKENNPLGWALAKNNLGIAYRQSASVFENERDGNLDKAIKCFQQALTVRTESAHPRLWAQTLTYLGNAHAMFIPPQTDQAIQFYRAALGFLTRSNYPPDWAVTQANMGNAFLTSRPHSKHSIEASMQAVEQALTVFDETTAPEQWAFLQLQLARGYLGLAMQNPGLEFHHNVQSAIQHNSAALRVLTKEQYPLDWAHGNYQLAICYTSIANTVENIVEARKCMDAALEIYTPEEFQSNYNDAVKLEQTLDAQISGRSLPGLLTDEPQFSPLNRRGLVESLWRQLNDLAARLGLHGRVVLTVFGNNYGFMFETTQEDLENPNLEQFRRVFDAVNHR